MRIEGYIEHSNMKITVFKMENRFSIKFETNNYEQTYKLRTGGVINTFNDVKEWVDQEMLSKVLVQFNNMHQLNMEQYSKHDSSKENEFELII